MAKLELIKNLQQTLKEMKNARAKLDEDIELFRNNSSNGEFFSENQGTIRVCFKTSKRLFRKIL